MKLTIHLWTGLDLKISIEGDLDNFRQADRLTQAEQYNLEHEIQRVLWDQGGDFREEIESLLDEYIDDVADRRSEGIRTVPFKDSNLLSFTKEE